MLLSGAPVPETGGVDPIPREELISTEIHKTYSNLETRINDWIKNYEK